MGALCLLLVPLAAAPGVIVLGGLLIVAGLAVAPASSVQFALVAFALTLPTRRSPR